MTELLHNHSVHTGLNRQGWVYSVMFHALVGACALLTMSGLTLSSEPDSFQWNVALLESSSLQPTVDPLSEILPDPPPTPSPAKSRPVPPQPTTKPVQHHVAHVPQEVPDITSINQTASTILAQPDESHEVTEPVAPRPATEEVVAEDPDPVHEPTPQEPVTSTEEPLVTQSATDSVVRQPEVEAVHEARFTQPLNSQHLVALAAPVQTAPAGKPNYDWLMRALLGRIDELKNYPVMARMNRWEGKVVLRAVIKDDGQVLMVDVQESSGRSILDNDAMETLKKASPLKLDHPLGKPQVAILMPISYSLR